MGQPVNKASALIPGETTWYHAGKQLNGMINLARIGLGFLFTRRVCDAP